MKRIIFATSLLMSSLGFAQPLGKSPTRDQIAAWINSDYKAPAGCEYGALDILADKVNEQLKDQGFRETDVRAISREGRVILIGAVNSRRDRESAEKICSDLFPGTALKPTVPVGDYLRGDAGFSQAFAPCESYVWIRQSGSTSTPTRRQH